MRNIHVRTARDLDTRHTNLLLKRLRTQDLSKRTGNLGPNMRRIITSLSHERFRRYVHGRMAVNRTFPVHEAPEHYTSRTCGLCGVLSRPGAANFFVCAQCGAVFGRNVNGSRNVLLYRVGLLQQDK